MYSPEEVDYLLEEYSKNKDVAALAKALNKTERSIIGKLSRLGVYERKVYLTKRGERPVTKLEYVARISKALEIPLEKLQGLEKTPKTVLVTILEALQ